jgi:hypothetical protein
MLSFLIQKAAGSHSWSYGGRDGICWNTLLVSKTPDTVSLCHPDGMKFHTFTSPFKSGKMMKRSADDQKLYSLKWSASEC